ncbi:hypothetical protein TL16_g03712 [Triparma laevis f. inornata]|uniref:RRM domain-containing protein n=1 Tax=Triparma laevis f. inornata TaxID=1714386 RepID=A0A9W7A8U8_9STRA|nr:hypothetical protein TL16_g03712 [Triparma laevis f. inornata]
MSNRAPLTAATVNHRNQDATVYVGNLSLEVTDAVLLELFTQAGPVVSTFMPKDKITGQTQGYGFVEFATADDCAYAIKILNMIKLFNKPLRVNKSAGAGSGPDEGVGANLFIGNLDAEADEKLLHDTFSAFGLLVRPPKVARDDDGAPKGYAFVAFSSFESSDLAIEVMNNQYLCNRQISIQYAYRKDGNGERHGSAAERMLAAANPSKQQAPAIMAASPLLLLP